MKRARPEEPQAEEPQAQEQQPEDERFPWEKSPEKYIDGSSSVSLKFVGTASEAADVEKLPSYGVEFVHQIFEPEGAIECPAEERPMCLEVVYSSATLDVCHKLDPTKAKPATADAITLLAAALPNPPENTYAELVPKADFTPAGLLAGELLSTYTLPDASPTYEVYAAALGADAPPERLRFAERLQSIFRFCIETSESIDTADDRWSLLTIFERSSADSAPTTYRLVAACTLYRFQRWVAGEGPVPLMRVCQVSSLPPFRGKGHGSRLLQCVYDHAKAAYGAREVTVEDPNASFRLLRDLVDYRNCVREGLMQPAGGSSSAPSAETLSQARAKLRITEEQLTRCYEIAQYAKLGKAASEEQLKPWRLVVKRRLLKLNQEELDAALTVLEKSTKDAAAEAAKEGAGGSGAAPAAAEAAPEAPSREALVAQRKARLEELFQALMLEYDEVLKRAATAK